MALKLTIVDARMEYSTEDGYIGATVFTVEGHEKPYEITLQSKLGKKSWNYSLHFQSESGSEEGINAVEEWLEEDDDAFDELVEAAKSKVEVE